jgi:hypothetical protein
LFIPDWKFPPMMRAREAATDLYSQILYIN